MQLQDLWRRTGLHLTALALIAVLGAAGASLGGCETTEGAGRDIESAGEGIQDAAD